MLPVLLTACGGEVSVAPPVDTVPPADAEPPPDSTPPFDAPPPLLSARFDGGFVRRAFPRPEGGYVVLVEPPMSLHLDHGLPRREVRWIAPDGREDRLRLTPTAGEQLLDCARHPSGALTVLLASDAGYRLVRVEGSTVPRSHAFVDPAIDADAPALPPGTSKQLPSNSHDTGRLAAVGEDVVLAARTGRNSVVVHRLRVGRDGLVPVFRTLAFPPASIVPIGLTGGSHDTFGQVDAQHAVHVAVDATGFVYVGVRYPEMSSHRYARLVAASFGETVSGDADGLDSYVARLDPSGKRLGTSVVTTEGPDEIYGLRATDEHVLVLGRTETWRADGSGHDALIARIGHEGAVKTKVFDVSLGDLAFDAAPAPDGGYLVVGVSGYVQNPSGASVSEASQVFARWLRADGTTLDLPVPTGPRHNEARFARLEGHRLLLGGMLDGPGTHTADGDPSRLFARGFLVQIALPGH